MRALTVKACAKVNLSLFITGQRPDGYHLLDMVMQSVSLCDELLLEEDGAITLQGDTAGAAGTDNLAIRAACLLARESGLKAGCRITLKKRIPAQAGMGGGSADAAAVLLGLNQLWGVR
ncbi:MAG: 4-(cytidine 5'-diphospho)-2-C-methyl-D-erythritol kinase, partial [Christensenellaceae bacterium]